MAIDIRRVTRLAIGINTENGVEQYEFDIKPWKEEYPRLTHFQLNVTPPGGGDPYIAETHMEGDFLVWPISEYDTACVGNDGEYEIEGVGEDCHKLSPKKALIVYERMEGTLGDPPDPMESWLTQAAEIRNQTLRDAERAEAAAERAEEAGGISFEVDETLTLANGILSVNTADDVEKDNTLPVTSAAVYAEVGNINALLETI